MLWFLSRNNLEYCFEKIQERWRGDSSVNLIQRENKPETTRYYYRIIMECGLMIVLCVHWASFLAPNCNENWHIYLGASSYQAHIVQLWQMFSIRCRPCDVNSKYFVTLIAHRSALINGTEGPLGLTQLKSLSWLWSSNVERTNLPWLVVLLGQNATKKGYTFSSRNLN